MAEYLKKNKNDKMNLINEIRGQSMNQVYAKAWKSCDEEQKHYFEEKSSEHRKNMKTKNDDEIFLQAYNFLYAHDHLEKVEEEDREYLKKKFGTRSKRSKKH